MAVAEEKRDTCAATVMPATFPSGKTEFVIAYNRRSARASASAAAAGRSAIAGRALDSREFGRGGFTKGKIAAVAANVLISLETTKENVWNSLEKAWKSLEFPCKSLEFPWNGLEKFGPVGPAAATPSSRRSWRFRAGF